MLRVELDIFSGRPNPTWTLSANEEQELLDRIIAQSDMMLPLTMNTGGLGYRGYIIRLEKEDEGPWTKFRQTTNPLLPTVFRIGGLYNKNLVTEQWLLDTSDKADSEVDDFLQELAQNNLANEAPSPTGDEGSEDEGEIGLVELAPGLDGPGMCCVSNYFTGTNFSFWNGSSYVTKNNCYCFASNHRANIRYALPGRYGGNPADNLSYAEMEAGLAADGWSHSCQTSRNLSIALVIWPGWDFHFYRTVTSSYIWGHKPGATPAKKTDDSGNTIYDPETCDRGNYTDFYGYWYQDNNTAYVA